MKDLLELALREGARELRLQADQKPALVVRDTTLAIDSPVITSDNVLELLQSVATREHLAELQQCGDVHFIYLFQNSARFAVAAAIQDGNLAVRITNLGR